MARSPEYLVPFENSSLIVLICLQPVLIRSTGKVRECCRPETFSEDREENISTEFISQKCCLDGSVLRFLINCRTRDARCREVRRKGRVKNERKYEFYGAIKQGFIVICVAIRTSQERKTGHDAQIIDTDSVFETEVGSKRTFPDTIFLKFGIIFNKSRCQLGILESSLSPDYVFRRTARLIRYTSSRQKQRNDDLPNLSSCQSQKTWIIIERSSRDKLTIRKVFAWNTLGKSEKRAPAQAMSTKCFPQNRAFQYGPNWHTLRFSMLLRSFK